MNRCCSFFFRSSLWFGIVGALALQSIATVCFSQVPVADGGGGGGGTNPPPLTLTLDASPNPVLVGKTVTVVATAGGGTPPYEYGWFHACEGEPVGPLAPSPRTDIGQPMVYQFCAGVVGNIVVHCTVTDSAGASKDAQATVQVLAPDRLEIAVGSVDSNPRLGPTTVMTGVHKFVLKRGNEEVGGCLVAPCGEKLWPIGQPEPDDWMMTDGTEPGHNPPFYFQSPYIYDTRFWVSPDTEWNNTPIGGILWQTYQRVKVDVPQCEGDPIEVESERLLFQVIKISDTRVRFLVTVAN